MNKKEEFIRTALNLKASLRVEMYRMGAITQIFIRDEKLKDVLIITNREDLDRLRDLGFIIHTPRGVKTGKDSNGYYDEWWLEDKERYLRISDEKFEKSIAEFSAPGADFRYINLALPNEMWDGVK